MITEAPARFYAMDPDGDQNFAGFACTYSDPHGGPAAVDDRHPEGLTNGPVCWVPLAGGEITQDDPETGETHPTGITLTAADVAFRLETE